ncbi:MAG TPA: signal peptide peptidase SppA [Xanthomonadaceae bacterium]|nr:signal peptide peptidase SppA [Xanthomonadaceae bacterium]
MSEQKPGLFLRGVRGFWRFVDASRRFTFNLIFLALVIILVVILAKGAPELKDRSALVLAPEGMIVEQYSVDPVGRAITRALGEDVPEVQLRDILRALERAAGDDRVERLVIRPDRITGVGMAALREIGQAITRFKESGKQVVAYADFMDQRQYYLAAFADEIYLNPEGVVFLEGLARYRNYYREALEDKLAVDVHLFRVGEYKSAAEPYILDGPSEEAREADLFWMGDLWTRYLEEIAAARGLEAATLQGDIDAFDVRVKAAGGDLAELALDQGLVDGLRTEDQIRALLIERGVEDEDEHSFRQVSMSGYLGFLELETLPIDPRPQLAVVVAQGAIMDGEQPPGNVGGVSTAKLLRKAREDEEVKAVVLRVDSPGGGVFPSEQIRREVELIKQAGKPLVVSMANVAASGGYWISMNADEIVADPSTITGSIGIFGLFFTAPDTLDKIGVHTGGVGTTRMAGALDPRRELQPIVGEIIQSIIDDGYSEFIGKVAHAREMSPEQVDAIARGRVWSGAQAHERGLVDTLGGLDVAIASAAERAGLEQDKYRVRYIEKDLSPFEQFVQNATRNAGVSAALAHLGLAETLLGTSGGAQARADLALLLESVRTRRPFGAVAYCFCEL